MNILKKVNLIDEFFYSMKYSTEIISEEGIFYIDDNKFTTPYLPSVDFAVDGSHPGLMHNTQYSNKLFDWISIKYPNMFTLNNYENKLL